MILTFDDIKANAIKNYRPTPKVEFIEVKDYSKIERASTIIGLAIATILIAYCIVF